MKITAADLVAIADVDDLRTAANLAWGAGNNAGAGFEPDDDIGELVLAATSDDQVSIYRDSDGVILVGDAGGAWAVRVRA